MKSDSLKIIARRKNSPAFHLHSRFQLPTLPYNVRQMAFEQILLIDDDEDDHEIFISAAKGVSASVSCTTLFNAKEALKKLAEKEVIPDVIFLDLNMPVMSGQQFLKEIKQNAELKNIPVIIFTTTSHSGTIQITKELGAHDFIIKPGRFEEWVSLLKPLLR